MFYMYKQNTAFEIDQDITYNLKSYIVAMFLQNFKLNSYHCGDLILKLEKKKKDTIKD